MQLGARWRVGDPPHPSAPSALLPAVAACEAEHPTGVSWTLTWLEGRPRAELLDATGTPLVELGLDADGRIASEPHDDDDWLA